MEITERFLNYTQFDTQSSEESDTVPSTSKQLIFAKYLKEELEREGLSDVEMDEQGYIYATLKANTKKNIPTIGFISHYDTSPDCSGANIHPRIAKNYDGDADKLARVFDNLFRNAVSYSDPGTTVSCRAYAGEDSVVVAIQNRGDTIPPHQLDRIFDKFYRVDAARRSATGGTGLGLSFAKQIVELHGGSISVTSRDGLTAFTVTLPMS